MPKKKKNKIKVRWKNVFKFLFFVFVIVLIINVIIVITQINKQNNNTDEMIKKLNKTPISNIVDDKSTKVISPPEDISKFDSYWDYIKMSLINVDLTTPITINKDTCAWLDFKSIDINYPVLCSSDDSFYTTHSLDKSINHNGWLFIGKDSNLSKNENIIIYGNNNSNDKLFGNMNKVFKESFKNDTENQLIRLYTNDSTSLWQIVSVYHGNDLEDYNLLGKSEVNFTEYINDNDKILTLVALDKKNIIVKAKLLKYKPLKKTSYEVI